MKHSRRILREILGQSNEGISAKTLWENTGEENRKKKPEWIEIEHEIIESGIYETC